MLSALKKIFAPKKEEPSGFSGTGVVLMADLRAISKLAGNVSPAELIESLNRLTTSLIGAVERHKGIVHLHVGGSLIAYWPPSAMPAAPQSAVAAASDAVTACSASIAVTVAIGEIALADVGPATAAKPLLVGTACKRAEATLRISPAGKVAVDPQTLAVAQ